MKCIKCGQILYVNDKYCTYCGAPVPVAGKKKTNNWIIPVFCGVLIVFLITFAGFGFFLVKLLKKENINKTTVSPSISSSTEASQEATEPNVTTEEPAPEIILAEPEVFGAAYVPILENLSYYIENNYYWQFGYTTSSEWPYIVLDDENPCIGFAEITGDDIPEMFVVYVPQHNEEIAQIDAYTQKNGQVECIWSQKVGSNVAGGSSYILFTNAKNDLYLYTVSYDSDTTEIIYQITCNDAGSLVSKPVCKRVFEYDTVAGVPDKSFFVDGISVSESEYDEFEGTLTVSGLNAIVYDKVINTTDIPWIARILRNSMRFGEAMYYLCTPGEVSEGTLPFNGSMNLEFSSGAGGWWTDMVLYSDGSFEANFHDSDMGDSGDDYPNGTVYIGSAKGKFTDIKKIDDYTYSMKLDDYTELTTGSPYIEDGTLWVPSDTYGLCKGDILFCLPGKPMSEIDEEAAWWGYAFHLDIMSKKVLPDYMFYSTTSSEAFYFTSFGQ